MKSIKLPLNNVYENFDTVDDYMDVVKENIKNLLYTNPGDRVIRRSKLGIPIKDIFFENTIDDAVRLIQLSLSDNIKRYLPNIRIDYVREIEKNENANSNRISLEIKFTDLTINETDSLIVRNN